MKQKVISLTSDFGKQSQGIAAMEGTIVQLCPEARIIHLMHGIPDFSIMVGARTMETIQYLPIGAHVCVVDPSVGTKRRGIILQTKRGDYLIGPDNGVLIPAARMLGMKKVHELTNEQYMRTPVSPIFHGRDVFAPAAAWVCKGVRIEEFGDGVQERDLVAAPYEEAKIEKNAISAKVIYVNKFGSIHLNILQEAWDQLPLKQKSIVELQFPKATVTVPYMLTFGDVPKGSPVIMKDDYGRIEVAINQGNFAKQHAVELGMEVRIRCRP